ncbi:ABC transporter ATP-binding protein [Actinomyces sp. B33]|uniref:ABC transporter ATP-binding protein n=1 Tax=Actinomyces sp. B33 TaxID=2942131 RepID=UPI0023415937|nr:ABC transporter ATP-binding protein [Actinomyces sp. B33]MDC4233739.1 ABC transporter ATP-binding protein [Actinomyces sp. B33]
MPPILAVNALTKTYGDFTLGPLDLAVDDSGITGLIGSNGAGKTTAIKAILGLIRPDGGSVELLGLRTSDDEAALVESKKDIGVVFDTAPFPAEMRLADLAAIGRTAFAHWDRKAFARLLDDFSLNPGKRVKELSRGMGMKLQLAFALAHRPRLLILDEATAGLDPLARAEILDLLRGFVAAEGHGILMSTHITTDLERAADRIVCLDHGSTAFHLTTDEICDTAGIARCTTEQADQLLSCGLIAPGRARVIRRGYSVDVLVPDRRAIARALPQIPCDRVSIEDYMHLSLTGEGQ